jgi:transposase
MVNDNRADYRSEWAAFTAISKLFGYVGQKHSGPGFVGLVVDAGSRAEITSDERTRLKELERENKDLRRANAILKDASIFFASEPGAQTRK